MGNSNSSTSQRIPSDKSNSLSPPRSNLRAKKKSLELPDLASLTFTSTDQSSRHRHATPPKSASIPIPAPALDHQRPRPNNPVLHPDDDALVTQQPSTHIPFPPTRGRSTAPTSYFRGSTGRQQQAAAHARVQELYNQSNVPIPSPASSSPSPVRRRNSFVAETVHSSIPIALSKALDVSDGPQPSSALALVPVKIIWSGGGSSVLLARAGDDDWKGRRPMERESPASNTYTTTVDLPPGTHHIRFIVDDHWRIAEDLPQAVDDQGSLANYVAVPLSYSPPRPTAPPPPPAPTKKTIPGQSFWSADSSADSEEPTTPSAAAAAAAAVFQTTQPPTTTTSSKRGVAKWTSVLPPELIEAAREEEAYLQASAGHYDSSSSNSRGGTTHINGFVPAPNIPPAPGLPRHLDKLILNTRVAAPSVASSGSAVVSASAPIGGSGRGHRRDGRGSRKEKEREGRRGAHGHSHGHPPPAPPPSEIGEGEESGVGDGTPIAASTVVSGAAIDGTAPVEATEAEKATKEKEKEKETASKLTDASLPALTDDASVLPVPSHVVLHHLSTSAIRNGVLAVANTTRYRKKYLTTIYYKPT